MESNKRTSIILWTGAAAAVGSIAAVAVFARWIGARKHVEEMSTHLRDIQDVLSDCYRKINEIEEHLPEIADTAMHRHPAFSNNGTRVTDAVPEI